MVCPLTFFNFDGRRPFDLPPWPETCQDSFVKPFLLCTTLPHARLILVTLLGAAEAICGAHTYSTRHIIPDLSLMITKQTYTTTQK